MKDLPFVIFDADERSGAHARGGAEAHRHVLARPQCLRRLGRPGVCQRADPYVGELFFDDLGYLIDEVQQARAVSTFPFVQLTALVASTEAAGVIMWRTTTSCSVALQTVARPRLVGTTCAGGELVEGWSVGALAALHAAERAGCAIAELRDGTKWPSPFLARKCSAYIVSRLTAVRGRNIMI